MSLLKDLEQRLEMLLEGFFARQFKSGIQPVEIAKKLIREMDGKRTVSVSKVYVPNRYIVKLNSEDYERLKPFESTLLTELQGFLLSHARKESYEMIGKPRIQLDALESLSLGEIAVESILESRGKGLEPAERTNVKVPPVPRRAARPARQQSAWLIQREGDYEAEFQLMGATITIGRSNDNDIVLADPNVSRYHANISAEGTSYVMNDLGSTNGTYVDGYKTPQRILQDGDIITIGTTKFTFRSESRV